MKKQKLVLASGSPRRREILDMAGYRFSVICPDADEADGGMKPEELVVENASRKAAAALKVTDGVIICSDTVVVLDGDVLGKPGSADNARRMLQRLSGKTHTVATGWCITDGAKTVKGVSTAEVSMRVLETDEVEAYIATGSPLDKAGAYGIQDAGAMFVSRIKGDFYTVMGLPICEISQILRKEYGILPFMK